MEEKIKKEKIRDLVRQAIEVSDFFQEPYRAKVFEIFFSFLLENNKREIVAQFSSSLDNKESKTKTSFKGLSGGIEFLIQESFFNTERTLKEIHDELIKNGYHYPKTSLPSVLISLVRKKQIARILGRDKMWHYILTK